MFNSLLYAKRLEEVGFTREQAEVHVQIVTEVIESNFTTKQDLKDLRYELKSDMAELKSEFKIEISDMKNELTKQTNKLGVIVSIAIGVAVTLAKLVSTS